MCPFFPRSPFSVWNFEFVVFLRLIADYLCQNYVSGGNVKFVLAGRSSSRLEELKVDICNQNAIKPASISTAIADVGDYGSLVELAKR